LRNGEAEDSLAVPSEDEVDLDAASGTMKSF